MGILQTQCWGKEAKYIIVHCLLCHLNIVQKRQSNYNVILEVRKWLPLGDVAHREGECKGG